MNIRDQLNQLDFRKSVTIGLVLAVLYYFLGFNDGSSIEGSITQLRGQIATQQSSLAQVKKALADKKKFEIEIKNIDLNMKDFNRYFIEPMDILSLSGKVSQFAENNQLIITSLKPAQKTAEFPDYPETAVDFIIEGKFHDIMTFVGDLTKMQKAIDFSTMEFTTITGGDFPVIQLKTTLVVYGSREGVAPDQGKAGVSNNG